MAIAMPNTIEPHNTRYRLEVWQTPDGEYSVANYDLYMTQAKLVFIFINHKLMIKHAIECIVLN